MSTKARHALKVAPFKFVTLRINSDVVLWVAIFFFGGMLTWLSIARYEGYNASMFDLGNMAQSIASVQRGEPLVFTYSSGQMSRLALHVEWIYFALALPYALWPDPRLLVGIQAVLFALGAIPVYTLASRRLNSVFAARSVALIYLLYPVAQTSVLLDIHGDTLAMPLLLFALDACDRRAWRTFGIFIALALSCKFYVAAPVAVLGLLIWWQYGERRVGMLTTGAAVVYGLFTFLIIRPLFTQTSEAYRGINYISFYFDEFQQMLTTWDWRLANAGVVFGPALFIAWRGWRWLFPGLVVALAALISTKGGSAGYGSHHYALVVPFVVMATIDGVKRMQGSDSRPQKATNTPSIQTPTPAMKGITGNKSQRQRRNWRGDLGMTMLIVIIFNLALIDTPLSPTFWIGLPNRGLDQARFGITPRDEMKDRFLAQHVPPDAPIATSLYIAPHLADREILYMVRYGVNQGGQILPTILPAVDYVLADALFDFRLLLDDSFDGGAQTELEEISQMLRDPAFSLVTARDGLLLFQRDAATGTALEQRVEIEDQRSATPVQMEFGDTITMVEARIEPLEGRRFRATFAWRISGEQPLNESYVAVSQLEGVADTRFVHLPTYALLPTDQWVPGQIVQETFDIVVPDDVALGEYAWRVGWYDLSHSEAYATDARSRLPGSQEAVVGTIIIP